jgi:hypothetical protein
MRSGRRSGTPRLSCGHGWFGAPPHRVQLAPRMLESKHFRVRWTSTRPDLRTAIAQQNGCFSRVARCNYQCLGPFSRSRAAARVGRERGDSNYDTTVGLSGAPDDRIAPGVRYQDPLFAA